MKKRELEKTYPKECSAPLQVPRLQLIPKVCMCFCPVFWITDECIVFVYVCALIVQPTSAPDSGSQVKEKVEAIIRHCVNTKAWKVEQRITKLALL